MDSMINKPTLSSNHAAFLNPSIGQYCLILAAKNSMRNAVGEQNAAILGRWAILMMGNMKPLHSFILELIRLLTAALEELWSTSTINEEVLRTINIIFANFYKLHISKATTLCIPPIWKGRSSLEVMLLKNLSWTSYAS